MLKRHKKIKLLNSNVFYSLITQKQASQVLILSNSKLLTSQSLMQTDAVPGAVMANDHIIAFTKLVVTVYLWYFCLHENSSKILSRQTYCRSQFSFQIYTIFVCSCSFIGVYLKGSLSARFNSSFPAEGLGKRGRGLTFKMLYVLEGK